MMQPNQDLINRFFYAYGQHDLEALKQVVADDMRWIFPGQNPFSGTKQGPEAVIAFFDAMGGVMGSSNIQMQVLVTGVNDSYVSEVQHITTHRADGVNFEQTWCVIWKFADGKIVEGRHLASDQQAADAFFNQVAAA